MMLQIDYSPLNDGIIPLVLKERKKFNDYLKQNVFKNGFNSELLLH